MSIQSIKESLHQKIESTNDSSTLMFYLYVANQLMTDQPDYTFSDDADLNQLVHLSTLVEQVAWHPGITSSVVDEKLIKRAHTE